VGAMSDSPHRVRVRLSFDTFPVQASLGVLGRKWAFLVVMKIATSQAQRFNELLRATPGMSKRILAMRLRELEAEGFLCRLEQRSAFTKWGLTQKGADVLPILLTMIHFGSKWPAERPLSAGEPRPRGSAFDVSFLPKVGTRTKGRTPTAPRTRAKGR
jgi:DNA-binding HxlR family transcriptional regulator